MNSTSTLTARILFLIACFLCLFQNVQAKSVYSITNHLDSTISAYKVLDDEIQKQLETNVDWGEGAVGLALDPDSETLFVSYDDSYKLEMINAKTMTEIKYITAPAELAGLVFDQSNQKLYAVGRETKKLFVYRWDGVIKILTLEDDSPQILENLVGDRAFGIALDENAQHLFVTDKSYSVKYYRTSDWLYQGSIDIVVNNNQREAIGIAFYDNGTGCKYLYTGGYVHVGLNTYLVRTDITDINNPTSVEKDIGSSIIGVGVDQNTGFVYVTTTNSEIQIFNHSTFPTDPCNVETEDIYGPADIIVRGDTSYKPPVFSIVKDNNDPNNNCVNPSDYLTFDIIWDANNHSDTNVYLIDYLPADVDYYSSQPQADDYNSTYHTVTWDLGNLSGTESDSYQITTKVNDSACSCKKLTNTAYLESDNYFSPAAFDVNVCFLGGYTIYVDKDVNDPNGSNSGTNWQDAFSELQTALNCPPESFSSVWVAQGTYKPVYDTEEGYEGESFELLNNLALLGHFAGNETSQNQRNFADANNETILEGQIGETYQRVNNIVTAENIDGSLIDGFTIKSALQKGLYINDSNLAILNCEFWYNWSDGIYCENSSELDIYNCLFSDNGIGLYVKDNDSNTIVSNCIFDDNDIEIDPSEYGVLIENSSVELNHCLIKNHSSGGIYTSFDNSNSNLTVKDCNIELTYWNDSYGIYAKNCNLLVERCRIHHNAGDGLNIFSNYQATIINNWIYSNADSGIYMWNTQSSYLIRNNTIYGNTSNGIERGVGSYPQILNCIIWDNGDDLYNCSATFSCIKDNDTGDYNIHVDPDFMNIETDPNDLHISENSPCKDKGDSNDISDTEIDIDGEGRIKYGKVDIGADEYYWSPADFDISGLVDFTDYAILANAFMCTPPDANYVEKCDLDCNDCINLADLELFCDDWLWECAWETGWMTCMGGGDGKGGGLMLDTEQSLIARPHRLAEQEPVYIDENVIYEALKWLDELWLSEDMEDSLTEEQYLMIRKLFEEELLRYLNSY